MLHYGEKMNVVTMSVTHSVTLSVRLSVRHTHNFRHRSVYTYAGKHPNLVPF